MLKGSTNEIKFLIEWFEGAVNKTRSMTMYNIMNCTVVCPMATSCICFHTRTQHCAYNWTKCEWKPERRYIV